QVADDPGPGLLPDLRLPARDRDVVDHDVHALAAPDPDHLLVELVDVDGLPVQDERQLRHERPRSISPPAPPARPRLGSAPRGATGAWGSRAGAPEGR